MENATDAYGIGMAGVRSGGGNGVSECKYKDEHGHCGLDCEVVFRGFCHEGPCSMEEPKTNGDRIRGMSDDELADEYIRIYGMLGWYTDSWEWLRWWLKQGADK